ncbi:hypothetical protein ZHAS_00001009 [Anopheles sinensis]|uniref:Uncharacterized protein n=1 Tax=Anopheles sinensis TaxID=74873 RepID=A0A084VAW7_ANOSI|nr:hypothetical protein ZHAS_00001009 [Anopheles sinensis]
MCPTCRHLSVDRVRILFLKRHSSYGWGWGRKLGEGYGTSSKRTVVKVSLRTIDHWQQLLPKACLLYGGAIEVTSFQRWQ